MTEAQWLQSADPERMLEFLRGKASARKLRLFVCACCRRIWPSLTGESIRKAVEVAEQFADGQATDQELTHARVAASLVKKDAFRQRGAAEQSAPLRVRPAVEAAFAREYVCAAAEATTVGEAVLLDPGSHRYVVLCRAALTAQALLQGPVEEYPPAIRSAMDAVEFAERLAQASILRELFGIMLFRPVTFDVAWRTPQAVSLAQTIYHAGAFDRMKELGDVLADAGCTEAEIVDHCRSPGSHVRGCWAVDLLTGRE